MAGSVGWGAFSVGGAAARVNSFAALGYWRDEPKWLPKRLRIAVGVVGFGDRAVGSIAGHVWKSRRTVSSGRRGTTR
jgi:hypothetical protein